MAKDIRILENKSINELYKNELPTIISSEIFEEAEKRLRFTYTKKLERRIYKSDSI